MDKWESPMRDKYLEALAKPGLALGIAIGAFSSLLPKAVQSWVIVFGFLLLFLLFAVGLLYCQLRKKHVKAPPNFPPT
jgi:hypothetical protein